MKNGAIFTYVSPELLGQFSSNLVCRVAYMVCIKYVNFIEISLVVIEIQGVENGELAVPVINTLVCHMAFLATDTQPCVLINLSEYKKKLNLIAKCLLCTLMVVI